MAFVSSLARAAVACLCAAASLSTIVDAQVPEAMALVDRTMAAAEDRSPHRRAPDGRESLPHGAPSGVDRASEPSTSRADGFTMHGRRSSARRRRQSRTAPRSSLWQSSSCRWARGTPHVELLTQMASAAPRDVQLRLTLAEALVATGKPAQAVQELDEAQGIAPADPELLFALASGYLRVKKSRCGRDAAGARGHRAPSARNLRAHRAGRTAISGTTTARGALCAPR